MLGKSICGENNYDGLLEMTIKIQQPKLIEQTSAAPIVYRFKCVSEVYNSAINRVKRATVCRGGEEVCTCDGYFDGTKIIIRSRNYCSATGMRRRKTSIRRDRMSCSTTGLNAVIIVKSLYKTISRIKLYGNNNSNSNNNDNNNML